MLLTARIALALSCGHCTIFACCLPEGGQNLIGGHEDLQSQVVPYLVLALLIRNAILRIDALPAELDMLDVQIVLGCVDGLAALALDRKPVEVVAAVYGVTEDEFEGHLLAGEGSKALGQAVVEHLHPLVGALRHARLDPESLQLDLHGLASWG